jgi:hypothetical protein
MCILLYEHYGKLYKDGCQRRLNIIQLSWASSRVIWLNCKHNCVSRTVCVLIIRETETEHENRDVPRKVGLLQFNQLTRLQARGSFMEL